MRNINQNIILNAEMKRVWDFITEPKNFHKYVYGYAAGKTTSANKIGVDATYEWYGKLGPFKIKSVEKIVVWQEMKYVAYSGKLFGIRFDSSMAVKKINEQTKLIVNIKYKFPIYFGGIILDSLLIRWIVKDYIKKSLDNLEKIFNK